MNGRQFVSSCCFTVVFAAVPSLFGCASNIRHISTTEKPVEKQKTFSASLDKVWTATQRALSEEDTVKILDRSSGIMVTEFRTIEARELSLAQTYFLGKTYKSSYTVNFISTATTSTDVRINVKLQAVQVVFLAREENNEPVEAYLRQKLFDKISASIR